MKTIEQNNRMIAEFMGGKYTYGNTNVPLSVNLIYIPKRGSNMFAQLEYNSSWDWLMPVVEKIELLGYSVEKNFQRIDNDWQTLITKGNDILFQDFAEKSIDAMYCTLVQFIEWYNEQK